MRNPRNADARGESGRIGEAVEATAHSVPDASPNAITVLRAKVPVRKTWTCSGCEPYRDAKHWRAFPHDVADLHDLAELLERVAQCPQACIIRGIPREPTPCEPSCCACRDGWRTRRKANFASAPDGLQWICIDVDGASCVADPRIDPRGAAAELRAQLPRELANGRCYYQLSASAGMKPTTGVHLWYWLDRPAHDGALREWAGRVPHIDAALFDPIQIHYTAPPRFAGLADPCPVRSGGLDGTPTIWPAGLLTPHEWRAHEAVQQAAREARARKARARRERETPNQTRRREARDAAKALRNAVDGILSAPEGGRNSAICRKANYLGRFVAAGALSRVEAEAALELAAEAALGGDWPARATTTIRTIAECLDTGAREGLCHD